MLRQLASSAAASQRISSWSPLAVCRHLPTNSNHSHSTRQLRVSVMAQAAERVPPEESLVKMETGYAYLDVRTPEEFAAGRPPGSINIPLLLSTPQGMQPNPEFVQACKAVFPDPTTPLVVGCKSGRRSANACAVLSQENYTDLVDNAGGWDGWAAAGLPVEK